MVPPQLPGNVKVLTVSELTRAVKGLLEDAFPMVWVSGEISNLARPSSGHVYLSLKDADSQLRSVIYRGVAMRLHFEPRDGMEVIARGRISVYQPRGEYQLTIEELHAKGVRTRNWRYGNSRKSFWVSATSLLIARNRCRASRAGWPW